MQSVTIDAGVIAVPDPSSTASEAYRYVDTLLDCNRLLDESQITVCMSEEASKILFENELYPLRDKLTQFFASRGIYEYDAHTVAPIVEKLLSKSEFFETRYMVWDILYEHLETTPNIVQQIICDSLQSGLERCLILMAVLRKYCSQSLEEHCLISRKAPEQKVVKVRAQIFEIQHKRDDIALLPQPPEFFESDVSVCEDFQGLMECLDEATMLVSASDDREIQLSIRIALFKHATKNGEKPEWEDIEAPKIGGEFRESCHLCWQNEDAVPSKIIRSIVETVRDEKLSDVHALKVDSGGNSPQQRRGSDKAYRREIDRKLRLHYWKCAGGTVELASVTSYHDDFSIPR